MRKIVKYKGITILYESHHKNKASDVEFGLLTGSYMDGKKLGLAHMFEHCMFFGTKNRTKNELSRFRSMHAASSNAYTNPFVTAITFYESTKSLDKILSVLSDHFFNSLPTEKEFENEKRIILNELQRARQDDSRIIQQTYLKMLQDQKRPLFHTLGNEKTINVLKINDLKLFRKKWFIRQNFYFSICTNAPLFKIKKLVDKHFIPFLKNEPDFTPNFIHATSNTKPTLEIIQKPNAKLCKLKLYKIIDKYSLENRVRTQIVENAINLPHGRIYQLFRDEHGLCYETPSIYTILSNNYGVLIMTITVTQNNLKKALDLTSTLFDDLHKNGITKDEFEGYKLLRERKKDVSLISPVRGEADSNLQTYYSRQKFTANRSYEKYRKSLSYEDIKDFSKELFKPSKIYCLVHGELDKKNIYSFSKIKKLFKVES